jgi:hypothetical protein
MSLARLWRDQGKRNKTHDLLAPVSGLSTEAFEILRFEGSQGAARRVARLTSNFETGSKQSSLCIGRCGALFEVKFRAQKAGRAVPLPAQLQFSAARPGLTFLLDLPVARLQNVFLRGLAFASGRGH